MKTGLYMRVGFRRGCRATFKRDRLTSTLLERQRSVFFFKLQWFNACVHVCMQMEKESLFPFCFWKGNTSAQLI
jgi:hypothetical protein